MAVTVQRKPSKTRRIEIKKTALDIIYSEGLKKLSTHHLAAKAGISEGTIFRHFNSKKEIIGSIVKDVKAMLVTRLHDIAMQDTAPDKRLEDFICYHMQYLKENKGITILLFTEASYQNNKELKEELDEIFHLQQKYFSKIILDGILNGIWSSDISTESLASLYMGIPIILNIEINLNPVFKHDNFCYQMLTLILKTLKK